MIKNFILFLSLFFCLTAFANTGGKVVEEKGLKSAHAYYISEYEILDREKMKPYSQKVESTFKPFTGRYIVRGGSISSLEGKGFKGGVVIIEFDSLELANAWYKSTEYNKIKPIRHSATKSRVYIIEGLKELE